ncbi:DUF4245 domain-containing protein [Pseudonocardia ammonioxydans]|nr:DUF4245 domain-containing protein [Pseudonocardia ammonioxydans]
MSARPDPSTSPSSSSSTEGAASADTAADDAAAADGAAAAGTAGGTVGGTVGGDDGGSPAPAAPARPRIGPRAMRKPERGETSIRDMLGALVILIPIGLVLFSVGTCSFSPAGPVENAESGPSVDIGARLTEYALGSAFPLRVPDVPFRANSTDRGPVEGGGTAVRVGYVTPDADYLSLVQTDASAEGVLVTESGSSDRGDGPPRMQGTVEAGGLTWEVYQREGGEPFRIATLGGEPEVRFLVTGSASEEQFRTLADSLATARVLPAGAPTG